MSDNNQTSTIANKEGREKFKLLIDEIVAGMTRKASEDEQIKETVKQIKAEFNIKTKVVNAVAKAAFKCNFNDVREEYSEIVDLYENVMTT